MSPIHRTALLTTLENLDPRPAKASLTRRETAAVLLREAVRKSDVLLKTIGDHGQISRQIDDKENLSFHHMFATWPVEVWRELLPLLVVEFGGESERVVRFKEHR